MKSLILTLITLFIVGFLSNAGAMPPIGYGYHDYQPPHPSSFRGIGHQNRIRFERGMSDKGYVLKIHLDENTDPDAMQITVRGRSLLIEKNQSLQQEEKGDRGYYSFSRSSSRFRQRFSLPNDADIENMQRSVEERVITITLPFLR